MDHYMYHQGHWGYHEKTLPFVWDTCGYTGSGGEGGGLKTEESKVLIIRWRGHNILTGLIHPPPSFQVLPETQVGRNENSRDRVSG